VFCFHGVFGKRVSGLILCEVTALAGQVLPFFFCCKMLGLFEVFLISSTLPLLGKECSCSDFGLVPLGNQGIVLRARKGLPLVLRVVWKRCIRRMPVCHLQLGRQSVCPNRGWSFLCRARLLLASFARIARKAFMAFHGVDRCGLAFPVKQGSK
jgi:hypothetical protein